MKKKIKDLTEEEISYLDKNHLCVYNLVGTIKSILNTEIDIPQPHILDKQEHDYLRAVCKPYKVECIRKLRPAAGGGSQFIEIWIKSSIYYSATESWSMPYFKLNSMYKGMEVNKKYTIEELELDKEWNND